MGKGLNKGRCPRKHMISLRSIFLALGLTAMGMLGCEESSKPPVVRYDVGIDARVDAGNNGRGDAARPANDAGYRHDVYDAGSDAQKSDEADYHPEARDAQPDTPQEEGQDAERPSEVFQNDAELPPECVDGHNEYQSCGGNNEGKSYRFCREGSWTAYTPCDIPNECEVLGQRVLFYTGQLETRNVGECKEGIRECVQGDEKRILEIVQPERLPGEETCNQNDDDCDGRTDEQYDIGAPCAAGIGGCLTQGQKVCTLDGLATICSAQPGEPQLEKCDGSDADCNGIVNNGYDLGTACEAGIGPCRSIGVKVCDLNLDARTTRCNAPIIPPQAEKCDGSDADCDGVPNNGYDLGAVCEVGVGACISAGVKVCDFELDARVTRCDAPIIAPQPEVCDSIDQDCDGQINNNIQGADCSVCGEQDGVRVCLDGIEYCSTQFEVRNGNFEMPAADDEIPCWETSQSRPRLVTAADHHGPICEGEYVVRKLEGDRNSYTLTQRVVVADRAQRIDAHQERIELSAKIVSADDYSRFGFRFYDSEGVLLGEQFEEFRNAGEGCQNRLYQTQIPERTRQVEIFLTGENRAGNTNNATFDDVRISFPE